MPHDMRGNKLSKGDKVRIPVHRIHTLQVAENPDAPDEVPGHFQILDPAPMQLYGTVVELYDDEEACNAEFEVDGALHTATFNTRLVELVDY